MKRALLVGINYKHTLEGCIADATAMNDLLETHEDGSRNFHTRLLTDEDNPEDGTEGVVTHAQFQSQIEELFAQPADVALLYFSGHGFLNKDLGGYLVTSDATQYREGVSMTDLLTLANKSCVKEVVVILDCCFSGSFGEAKVIGNNSTLILEQGRSILTASQATQPAYEQVFTPLVCDALSGGAADILGKVTIASTYAYLDEVLGGWDERPLLKANISHLQTLRQCQPQVPLEDLRDLPKYFATSDYIFPLDPSYEPTVEPYNEEHQFVFTRLQKFRAARLVEPIGEDHMYYAAINSTSCRLTKRGQFYWRLAKDKNL